MTSTEEPLLFDCEGESLLGILMRPDRAREVGVVVIVGGPQYRVGSHRQFVLLARAAAKAGFPALRFDYRGMGDSSGPMRSFEQIDRDIASAINTFFAAVPQIRRVVLWGLCDAASAAMMYAPRDARVAGLAVLNPWARSAQTIASARVKHYYLSRLVQRDFWAKLASGKLRVFSSVHDLIKDLSLAILRRRSEGLPNAEISFHARMAHGFRAFNGPVLAVFSGRDLTAKEFLGMAAADPQWTGLLQSPRVSRFDLSEADHTFSREGWQLRVEELTIHWLNRLADGLQLRALESPAARTRTG